MSARRLLKAAALALAAALLAACGSDKPKPTPLEAVTAQIAGRQVWNARVDSVQFPLSVAVRNGQFIVAGTSGTVLASAGSGDSRCSARRRSAGGGQRR